MDVKNICHRKVDVRDKKIVCNLLKLELKIRRIILLLIVILIVI